jgi:hypothetical protein
MEDEDEAIEMETTVTPPLPPTLSHSDMARPPHEDPEYQRKIVGTMRQGLLMSSSSTNNVVVNNTIIHNYAWSQSSPVSGVNVKNCCFQIWNDRYFCNRTDLATEAREAVAAAVDIVCTLSIAIQHILIVQLSDLGAAIPLHVLRIVVDHKALTQFAATAAATAPTARARDTGHHQERESKRTGQDARTNCRPTAETNARREQEVPKGVRHG